jgi:hypothetical protein
MAAGLVAGAALVDYRTGRADVALMGAVTGVGVGVMQTLVLARHRIPGAFWWAVANPPAWALGWFVTSYVITTNVDERFPLGRPDDRTHNETPDQRCSHGIDSVHDQISDVPADREADEDRHRP